ncbi:MAG TPA: nitroreductase family protein [Blastocatellia bacterium]|nr:nitroreductase family protein [Blastocatellia bacterium]
MYAPLDFVRLQPDEQRDRLRAFYELMSRRRTVRDFSTEPVPLELVELAIATAGTAPSGANVQPWRIVVVQDPEIKQRIREAAEAEERISYERRMPEKWLRRLAALGTDWHKPFLEVAPCLVVVFRVDYEIDVATGEREGTYYATESVGIAVGLLISALHSAGLATLTHTPSPMRFLGEILDRPKNETPFVLLPVGYPAEGAMVPDLARKPLGEILSIR